MAAYLGLVVHAAERNAREFPVRRTGDAHGNAGLARTRRADKAEHAALHVRRQLAHRQELYHSLLDLGKAEVVLVQHALGLGDIQRLL